MIEKSTFYEYNKEVEGRLLKKQVLNLPIKLMLVSSQVESDAGKSTSKI